MNFRKFLGLIIALTTVICLLSSCDIGFIKSPDSEEPQKQARSFYKPGFNGYFNTACVVISYRGDSANDFDANCNAVEELVIYYDKLFDIYY